MSNLQEAICDIETRAATGTCDEEAIRALREPVAPVLPASLPELDANTTVPTTSTLRFQAQVAKSGSAMDIEPSDPLQAAAHKLLEQMDATRGATLLLLAESLPPHGQAGNRWGHAFAGLIDLPVLSIELGSATTTKSITTARASRTIPQITQSEHPGLCTLATAWYTLSGNRSDRWWISMREQFGMILLGGFGLAPGAIESMLGRCSHVAFLVEYGSTSRSWASKIGDLIATSNTRSVGCIATMGPHTA